jgi:GNAT superfamily N-acetyltransferase
VTSWRPRIGDLLGVEDHGGLPDEESICAREGLTRAHSIVQLVAEAPTVIARYEELAGLDPELRLEPIGSAHARSWATMTSDVFESQLAGIPEMFEACVGRRDWHVFGVWHGDQLVSGGLSATVDDVALLFAGATRPEYRGRGAQSALIAARARAAAQAGCRWLVTQTGAENPGTHNSSLHNLLRLGFEAVYERPSWGLKP